MLHPAISMSKPRANAWLDQAEDKDFHEYLYALSVIYARRKREKGGKLDEDQLFRDFKQYRDDVILKVSISDAKQGG